jgi:hypothetical protein
MIYKLYGQPPDDSGPGPHLLAHCRIASRRVNGKPRPVPLLYLGKADDLLARLRSSAPLRIHSLSLGAVAALWSLASELEIQAILDRHLASSGCRASEKGALRRAAPPPPVRSDGLSVGQSLSLIVVGCACHPTSKRAFSPWARQNILGALAGMDLDPLTSQHFWKQMDQVPVPILQLLERDILYAILSRFPMALDTLLFDATNFFTFIASTNTRIPMAARGKQKQKRNDLRQIGVTVLCSRTASIPLWHCTFGANIADAKSFATAIPLMQQPAGGTGL